MKKRFSPILVILAIIAAAILSRFIGNSDYLLAQSISIYSYGYGSPYTFFYCPYNKKPYTAYPSLYPGYPAMRFPYPYAYPLPKQYPCPCTVPGINEILLDDYQQ